VDRVWIKSTKSVLYSQAGMQSLPSPHSRLPALLQEALRFRSLVGAAEAAKTAAECSARVLVCPAAFAPASAPTGGAVLPGAL